MTPPAAAGPLARRPPKILVIGASGYLGRHVRDRVTELTGLQVEEVHIVVSDLATDITPPPRVR